MTLPREILLEYRRPGKKTFQYPELLVWEDARLKVLFMDHSSAPDVVVGGNVILQHGAPIIWFIFPGASFDVGRFHLKDGSFTGWYTDLCTPVQIETDRWSTTDLFLDFWMPAKGEPLWLDQDEFEQAARRLVLTAEQTRMAETERARISELARVGAWPPAPCNEWDLARIRELLRSAR